MKKTSTAPRKLELAKTTVRTLDSKDLRQLAGGATHTYYSCYDCSGSYPF